MNFLDFWPPEHGASHPPQGPKAPRHICGHSSVLHPWTTCSNCPYSHSLPPCWATTLWMNQADCSPPPHCSEHCDHSVIEPLQSTGQGDVPSHAFVCEALSQYGQALPPYAASCVTAYMRYVTPPPHEVEHSPNSDQDPSQSSAQQCSLHVCSFTSPSFH